MEVIRDPAQGLNQGMCEKHLAIIKWYHHGQSHIIIQGESREV